jgi:hypothetical protein
MSRRKPQQHSSRIVHITERTKQFGGAARYSAFVTELGQKLLKWDTLLALALPMQLLANTSDGSAEIDTAQGCMARSVSNVHCFPCPNFFGAVCLNPFLSCMGIKRAISLTALKTNVTHRVRT